MLRAILLTLIPCLGASPGMAQGQGVLERLLTGFNQIDIDGDGLLSRAEYQNLEAARWAQLDRNGDGYLTEDDFPPAALRRVQRELVRAAALDADGDGRISRNEFLDASVPTLLQADGNVDGLLSHDELEAASWSPATGAPAPVQAHGGTEAPVFPPHH